MFSAFCLGFVLDLYHLSLQCGNPSLGKRCDTYCEILSSQAVVSLMTVGKYVLNKEAFKENKKCQGLRCIFQFTEGYYWYCTICFPGTRSSPEKLFILSECNNEWLWGFNLVDNSKSSGWQGH